MKERKQLTPEERKKFWETEANAGVGWFTEDAYRHGDARKPDLDQYEESVQ